jgi:hypothetical protein
LTRKMHFDINWRFPDGLIASKHNYIETKMKTNIQLNCNYASIKNS